MSSEKRFRIIFAGLPPTTVYGETSFVTTDRAAIMAPFIEDMPFGSEGGSDEECVFEDSVKKQGVDILLNR